jgi:hypothetical protein
MMASDDLAARKTGLENRLDSLDSWMIGFTWLVAVGLFIEFYAVLNLAITHDWNVLIDRVGLFLVTIGVSGELAIEHQSHRAERKLREANAEIELEADFRLKAADERIAELNLIAEKEHHKRLELEARLSANGGPLGYA